MNPSSIILIVVLCVLAAILVTGIVACVTSKTSWSVFGSSNMNSLHDFTTIDFEQNHRLREVRFINNVQAWTRARAWRAEQGMDVPDWFPRCEERYANHAQLSKVAVDSVNQNDNDNVNVNERPIHPSEVHGRDMNHGDGRTQCSDQAVLDNISAKATTRARSYINTIENHNILENEHRSHVIEWNDDDYGVGPSNAARIIKHGNFPVTPTKKRWTQHGAPRQTWMQPQVKINDNNQDVSVKDAYSNTVSQIDWWSPGSSGKGLRR